MIGLRELDDRFEKIKKYSNELQVIYISHKYSFGFDSPLWKCAINSYEFILSQNNITNVLRVRAALAERLYGIHKLHANYGRIFSEWSAVERDMGDGLQVRPLSFPFILSLLCIRCF